MDKAFELKADELGQIPIKLIDPDPEQPRKDFDEDYIKNELAPSIKKHGVIQPIVIRNNPEQPGRFFIVAGENRWRATKAAKVKTIPAVLREVDGLDKLIVQLKENHQRRDLNPMEWARALQEMNKTHGLKQADIEKTLKESGVGHFGRAYISNMIRLLELPEWAQSLIRNNAITASHGKFLLQAMASEKVMELLREEFEEDGWQPSTADLQRDIYWKFMQHHIGLNTHRTDFDYREKCVQTGCQKMRKLSPASGNPDVTFCLDQECHAILQAEAKKEAAEQRQEQQERDHEAAGEPTTREVIIDDDNRVDINQQELRFHRDYRHIEAASFDTSACEGCKHRHIAREDDDTEQATDSDSCFLVSCYIQKEDEARRAYRLVRQYLKDAATKKLRFDGESSVRFLAFLAAGLPELLTGEEGESIGFFDHGFGDAEEDEELLFKTGLRTMADFLNAGQDQLAELGAYAVNGLFSKEQLADLCAALNISIDDYCIDEHYLAEHTEEELSAMLEAMEWPPATLAEFYNAQQAGQLDTFIKQHAEVIGVPKAIRFAYQQLTQED